MGWWDTAQHDTELLLPPQKNSFQITVHLKCFIPLKPLQFSNNYNYSLLKNDLPCFLTVYSYI